MPPGGFTRSSALWFGKGASSSPSCGVAADTLAALMFVLAAWSCSLFWQSWRTSSEAGAALLFGRILPTSAFAALLVSSLIAVRTLARRAESRYPSQRRPAFGRKGNLICGASLLFIGSCCYRAVFVADEGASLCRGKPTPFNAPIAGRAIATVGEIALVVQLSTYLEDSACRLRVSKNLWARRTRFTLLPVCLAECFSWCGVLSGVSRFYCLEYVVWMLMSITWAWDAAELLHKSARFSDVVTHAALCTGGLALFFFNAGLEIPHFFLYHPAQTLDAEVVQRLSILHCTQDAESSLWVKRLPFFFAYFFGCSWGSAALSYRYLRRGGACSFD